MPCVALGLGPAAALCGPPVLSCVVGRGRFGEGLGVTAPRAGVRIELRTNIFQFDCSLLHSEGGLLAILICPP